MDQSVSPYLFREDTRHHDAMDQMCRGYLFRIDTDTMDQVHAH